MVDMNNRTVIIFGGGQVGERKAVLFCKYAKTTVISRTFTPALLELAKHGIELIKTSGMLSDDDITDYVKHSFIVVPATSDLELNSRISGIAREHSCLINSVDGVEDLAIPSIIERGDIIIAISTGGASPALSKYLRKKIEQTVDPHFEDMARLLKEIRPVLKQRVVDQQDRSNILWGIVEDREVWEAMTISYEQAMDIALKNISKYILD